MKIFVVTGCAGFMGGHFTRECLQRGYNVIGIDKMTYAANDEVLSEFLKSPNFHFIKEDINKLKTLPDCDYVINFAAESHVQNSIDENEVFVRSNISGVRNLLELIRNKSTVCNDRPLFVQISTDEVLGDVTKGKLDESAPLNPSNPYSASKAAAELLIRSWARTYGIKYLIFRPSNNYGTHQYPEKLIPLSVKNLLRGCRIRLHERGTPIRNFLHVEDTNSAIFFVLEEKMENEIFNISGDIEQTNHETVKKILMSYLNLSRDDFNIYDYVDLNHTRTGQDVRYSVNDSKLKSLGWTNKKRFDEEIGKIVSFYKTRFQRVFW